MSMAGDSDAAGEAAADALLARARAGRLETAAAHRRRIEGDLATPWLLPADAHYHWFGAAQWWLWVRFRGYGLRRRWL